MVGVLVDGNLLDHASTFAAIPNRLLEVDQHKDLLKTADLSEAENLLVDAANARAKAKEIELAAAENAVLLSE